MIYVSDALTALGIKDWVLRGEPTNQSQFNSMFAKVTGKDSNDTSVESNDPSNFGVTWAQVSAKLNELKSEEGIAQLRIQRDTLLRETDHWALSDTATMTQAQKDYRQALRDITKSYTSLDDVTWPTKP